MHRATLFSIFLCGLMLSTAASPCFSFAGRNAPELTTVVVAMDEDVDLNHDGLYYRQLLELALTKTIPTHGPFALQLIPVIPNENRLLRGVEQQIVDVMWMPFQEGMDAQVRPVKFRLLKNLSDYRVFLIRKGDQARFSAIRSLDDLRRLRGGMGTHWPDRRVMEANDLPLSLSVSYQNLFKMLAASRFDYFSRGIYQIPPEIEEFAGLGLAVEEKLLLHYANPVYFYVHKDNIALAERLKQGLGLAAADGTLDALFNQFPRFSWAQEHLRENRRLILRLQNNSGSVD